MAGTESEEEGNESEQEPDQRDAEPSQGPTITHYIVRQKGDIPQRIAQTKAELQETIKQGILLSAALEHHRGALKRMTNTPSHREQDPTHSKGEDLKEYREKIWVALKEGLNAAINQGLRRVTICLDGLRSHDLPWESAEKVASATAHHVVKNLLTDASLTEIVIVTSLSEHESLRELALVERMDEKKPKDPPHLGIPRIQQGNEIKPYPDENANPQKSEDQPSFTPGEKTNPPNQAKKDAAAP
ncbi:hypothetical protein CRENBAI_022708 [Crenichthys baileyi]|uniref:Uncharacterized protein n=1 Tax=Crenichthys baileyi TaxID=28760 RepID=A0AAV9SQR7_9TELE